MTWWSRVAALVVASASLFAACDGGDDLPDPSAKKALQQPGPPPAEGPADVAVTGGIHEIFGLEGETVIVSGTVVHHPAPGVFALRSDLLGKAPLWVVAEPQPIIDMDAQLTVEGVVVPTSEATLPSGVRDAVTGTHLIAAETVRTVAEVEAEENFLDPLLEEEAEIEPTTTTTGTGGTSTTAGGATAG